MRFPQFKKAFGKSKGMNKLLDISALDAGINLNKNSKEIFNNQLYDAENFWWNGDKLVSRLGFKVSDVIEQEGVCNETFIPYTSGREYETKNKTAVRFFDRDIKGETLRKANSYTTDFNGMVWKRQINGNFSDADCRSANFIENRGGNQRKYPSTESLLFLAGEFYSNSTMILGSTSYGNWEFVESQIHVPIISTDGKGSSSLSEPASGGKAGEDFNLLTPKFKSLFTTHGGTSIYYYLSTKGLDSSEIRITLTGANGVKSVYIIPSNNENSNVVNGIYFKVNRIGGYFYAISGSSPYALPVSGIANNLEFLGAKTFGELEESRKLICGMRYSAWFGGDRSEGTSGARLFLAGNDEYPGRIHWSGASKDLYFPQSNFTYVGEAGKAINALAKQSDQLIVFKEDEIYSIGYSGQSKGNDRVQFPVNQVSPLIGCDCGGSIQLCDGKLVWLNSSHKVYTLTGVGRGAKVSELSRNISSWLQIKTKREVKSALSAVFKGNYFLLIGNEMFIMNFEQKGYETYSRGLISGDRERIAWYRWHWDFGFKTDFLFCENDKFFVGGYLNAQGKTFLINGEMENRNFDQIVNVDFDGEGGYSLSEGEILTKLVTKSFDFGGVERLKNLRSILMEIGGLDTELDEENFKLYLEVDGEEQLVPLSELKPVSSSDNLYKIDLFLSRFRKISLRLESSRGALLKIGEISFDYYIYPEGR